MNKKHYYIAQVAFVLLVLASGWIYFSPTPDAKSFYDPVGYSMLAVAAVLLMVEFYVMSRFAVKFRGIFLGLAFATLCLWHCTELWRFSALDTAPATAYVDEIRYCFKFSDLFIKKTRMGVRGRLAHYRYQTTQGEFVGSDCVDSVMLKVGDVVDVVYLRNDHAVSRFAFAGSVFVYSLFSLVLGLIVGLAFSWYCFFQMKGSELTSVRPDQETDL